MANNKFKAAVARAKKLYKTGKYKRFSDAVKAAYKKVGAVKLIERGEKKNVKPKAIYQVNRTKKGLFTGMKQVGSKSLKRTNEIIYKGHTITNNLSGWYSAYTVKGYVKADTIRGVKNLIDNILKSKVGKKPSKLQSAKNNLAKACLDYELANTIKATKEAQKRKVKFRKLIRSL